MSIATVNEYWTSRMNGEIPSALTQGQDNESFALTGTGSDGEEVNSSWVISNVGSGQTWSLVPATNDYTMVACFKFNTAPADTTVLMKLDNGTHTVRVESTGDLQKLRLVGATTALTRDLDLAQADDFEPVPIMIRLTLDSSGNAKMYMREIVEDDDGATNYLSVTGASGSSKSISWGNTSGQVTWHNVYVTNRCAFSPDELSTSPFVSDSLLRIGLSIVNRLKDSRRFYLKNYVDNSSIIYGYDISSQMTSRIAPPSIHVILKQLDSPQFMTLGGSRIEQNFTVILFITTRGTDYKNAYRTGIEIAGDAFDELYTTTGLLGTTDSLTNYILALDTKMDDDEVICVHRMELTYMRQLSMLHR